MPPVGPLPSATPDPPSPRAGHCQSQRPADHGIRPHSHFPIEEDSEASPTRPRMWVAALYRHGGAPPTQERRTLPPGKASFSDHESDVEASRALLVSTVCCIHRRAGCRWSGELHKLKAHLTTCKYDVTACPFGCGATMHRALLDEHASGTCPKRHVTCAFCRQAVLGVDAEEHRAFCRAESIYCESKCGAQVQRWAMNAHRSTECIKRLVKCRHCRKEFVYETLKKHLSQCPRYPEYCPNGCHHAEMPREDLQSHLAQECSAFTCEFKDLGCTFRGTRSSIDRHVHSMTSDHLTALCTAFHRQLHEIRGLRAAVRELSLERDGSLLWKIDEFASRMAAAKAEAGRELRSPPFYAAKHGYKLRAALFLNGNGDGEKSHLSIYIRILPGEFDSLLHWPFVLPVTFTLYDQQAVEGKHVVESFVPDPALEYFGRPEAHGRRHRAGTGASLGYGFPKFVAHDTLKKRHYIRDDTLFVGVHVDKCKAIAV